MSQGTPEEVLASIVDGINTGDLDALKPYSVRPCLAFLRIGNRMLGAQGGREGFRILSG